MKMRKLFPVVIVIILILIIVLSIGTRKRRMDSAVSQFITTTSMVQTDPGQGDDAPC